MSSLMISKSVLTIVKTDGSSTVEVADWRDWVTKIQVQEFNNKPRLLNEEDRAKYPQYFKPHSGEKKMGKFNFNAGTKFK